MSPNVRNNCCYFADVRKTDGCHETLIRLQRKISKCLKYDRVNKKYIITYEMWLVLNSLYIYSKRLRKKNYRSLSRTMLLYIPDITVPNADRFSDILVVWMPSLKIATRMSLHHRVKYLSLFDSPCRMMSFYVTLYTPSADKQSATPSNASSRVHSCQVVMHGSFNLLKVSCYVVKPCVAGTTQARMSGPQFL